MQHHQSTYSIRINHENQREIHQSQEVSTIHKMIHRNYIGIICANPIRDILQRAIVFIIFMFLVFCLFDRDQRSPKSPQKFTYGQKVAESQYFSLEEPPRSPKITYSTPSPTSSKMADISGNVSPSSGYFEQRSPKYLSHQSSPRKFVFDAVSPRRESIGKIKVFMRNHTSVNKAKGEKKKMNKTK